MTEGVYRDRLRARISITGGNCYWSSYIGRRADALALRADERRDKLRKAAGSGKYTMIRGYLNGATHLERLQVLHTE